MRIGLKLGKRLHLLADAEQDLKGLHTMNITVECLHKTWEVRSGMRLAFSAGTNISLLGTKFRVSLQRSCW